MPNTQQLYIDGKWCDGNAGETLDVISPVTGQIVSKVAKASSDDIDRALEAAQRGFEVWRKTSSWERAKILRRVSVLLAGQKEELAAVMTAEIGKPTLESRQEIDRAIDTFEWCSEEATRVFGRLLPQRKPGARQMVTKVPIGPVAAFSPWNFPAFLTARKIATALGAGCSIIVKPAEEAPSVCGGLAQACHEAGVPAGVLNMLFGDPPQISERLIKSPVIRKVSLTGSVTVGRKLSSLAGEYLKPVTMELGGHAPVIVFEDANIEKAAEMTAAFKFRNAGQVCLGVGRVYVQDEVFEEFLGHFTTIAQAMRTGDGAQPETTMGPLVTRRGYDFMKALVDDALEHGAKMLTGGPAQQDIGLFWDPTILIDVPDDARVMVEEPFGPVVPIVRFSGFDEVVTRANKSPYGLAGYAFTQSLATSTNIADALDVGWVGINNFTPALSEAPFGGSKDSGIGSEGGPEGFDAYLQNRFVSQETI